MLRKAADALAVATSQQVVDGLLRVLPQQIPQRNIDCGDGPHFGGARKAAKAYERKEIVPMIFNISRIAANQQRGKGRS